ncbi:hypothetical protein Q8F57_003345 [Paraburkholderia terrae]|uniref:hypothetical protein n=1 Tax=Paraburkholderia terrae TaxID=311230 RepID=UPI00296AE740|nr:hypothetical protein [Paraburkholderia terrae]MDW3655439.1 hypothetical protein [Paraburkholderia terrae]
MALLEDIIKALERIPGWKRIAAAPDEIEALKKRVAELESQLSQGGGEICPICRKAAFEIVKSIPHPEFAFAGTKLDTMKCSACNHEETRNRDTM